MPQQPESELITKAMAGDRQAFSQLVASNQGYLYAIAYRYLSNEDEAEDSVQETFVKLWKNFSWVISVVVLILASLGFIKRKQTITN